MKYPSPTASRADLTLATDYYPFGSAMPGRSFSEGDYRYGFNGMEGDDELSGDGNSCDFGARMYDARIGRFLSLDPLISSFPFQSAYITSGNNPLFYIDKEGEEKITYLTVKKKDGSERTLMIVDKNYIEWKWSEKTTNYGHDYEMRYRGHDVVQQFTFDESTGRYTSWTKYYRREWAQGAKEFLGQSFEGPGGSQKGGYHLISKDGGSSKTKQISLTGSETRDVTDILSAFSNSAKSPTIPSFINIPSRITKVGGLGTEAIPKPEADDKNDPKDNGETIEVCEHCFNKLPGKFKYTTEDHGGNRIEVPKEAYNEAHKK